jgi:hypothetical protein
MKTLSRTFIEPHLITAATKLDRDCLYHEGLGWVTPKKVAIGEVGKFGQRGIESSGLSRGRFVHEEAVTDAVFNGFHQEWRDPVFDPGPSRPVAPDELQFLRAGGKRLRAGL